MDQNDNSNNNINSQTQNNQDINNEINSQPQLSEKELKKQETHEASQKTVHVAGKGLATYYGGAVGNKLYDAASKTKLGKGIESTVGKLAETSPMAKPIFRALNKSGALDAADKVVDATGVKDGSVSSAGENSVNASKNIMNDKSNSDSNRNMQYNRQKNIKNNHFHADTTNSNNKLSNMQKLVNNSIEASQNKKINEINNSNNEDESLAHELARKKLEKEKAKAKAKVQKKIVQLLINNPAAIAAIIAVALILILFIVIVIFVVMDVDFVGTGMSNYSEAGVIQNKCNSITLVLEDSRFTGEAVLSIEDVDLSETFTLSNGDTANRWSSETYLLDEYVKGVVNAEAREVNDKTTFEVASIVARTYALTITSSQCYTFSNENTRYSNPQQFEELTSSSPNYSDINSAVDATLNTVITKEGNLYDHSNSSYYDYFCYKEKTRNGEGEYYRMLQENKEERLHIHETWKKENVPDGLENNNCQENGMSLFGAKYLLTKEVHEYSTIRVIKYYYGYDVELKKVGNTFAYNGGCYYWPTTSTNITSFFGPRTAPIAGASTNHGAVDIGVTRNSDVYATTSGTVTYASNNCFEGNTGCGGGYGNYIKIDHGSGISSLYAHLSSSTVSVGDTVTQGQVIGKSGNTGRSTGPHLHFEIRLNNTKVDPLNYVDVNNPRPTNCVSNIGGAIVTNNNVQSVCLSLKNIGYSNEAIAAVLTNLSHENSAFDPTVRNSIQCLGIAQWCYYPTDQKGTGRLGALESLAGYNTIEVQINFMLNELSTNKNGVNNLMLAGGSTSDLTYKWCMNYEVPGESHCITRKNDTLRQNNYLNFAQNGCN